MTKAIAIIDRHQDFATILQEVLQQQLLSTFKVEYLPFIPRNLEQYSHLIINQQLITTQLLNRYPPVKICLICDQLPAATTQYYTICRQLPITEICLKIKHEFLTRNNSKINNALILLNTFEPHLRLTQRNRLLHNFTELGLTIYYLPLMPLYRIPFALNDIRDCTGIADLLLKMELGNNCNLTDLQNIFCDIETLKIPVLNCGINDLNYLSVNLLHQLIRLFRDLIKNENQDTVGLIETCEIPLKNLNQILPLVDWWYGDIPQNLSYGSKVARQEMTKLLANLPQTTFFQEIPA